jgi:short-subunit dehydrogenase
MADSNSKRKRALITGASGGIGYAFATQLAEAGYDLVLTGLEPARLEEVVQQLRLKYHTDISGTVADLADADGVTALIAHLDDFEPVDMLVNSAGFGEHKLFHEEEEADVLKMLNVQITATVRLVHALLPGMIARRSGTIITVSSLAAFVPAPGAGIYSSSKAFLNTFMETLFMEVHNSGIKVQSLCPGSTHTGFHAGQHVEESIAGIDFWMEPEEVVNASLKALENDEVVCVPGIINKAIKNIAPLLPRKPYYHLAEKIAARYRKETGSETR